MADAEPPFKQRLRAEGAEQRDLHEGVHDPPDAEAAGEGSVNLTKQALRQVPAGGTVFLLLHCTREPLSHRTTSATTNARRPPEPPPHRTGGPLRRPSTPVVCSRRAPRPPSVFAPARAAWSPEPLPSPSPLRPSEEILGAPG